MTLSDNIRTVIFTILLGFMVLGCSTISTLLKETDEKAADSAPMYEEGKGRADMILAILRPTGNGLTRDEEKYLDIIQGALNNDFGKFSEIQLFDSRNLDTILEQQQLSLSGNFSESDYVRIGQLAQSRYILTSELIRIDASNFQFNATITDVETGVRLPGHLAESVSLKEIINSKASRAAAAALLTQLGVAFTPAGNEALKTELSAEETEAQTALALSYEASRSGNLIDALIYSYAASDADKNSTAAREQAASAFRMMGGAGSEIKEDFKRREYWKQNLKAFEEFYRNHPPFELAYTSIPVMKGTPDYDMGTVDFEFSAGLRHKDVNTMQKVLNAIFEELRKTKYKKNKWGFDNWPAISAESTRANQIRTDLFEGHSTFIVEAALFNNDDEPVAALEFPMYGQLRLKAGNIIGAASTQEQKMTFTIKGDLITDDMQIRIISINGVDPDKSNADAYVKNYIVKKLPARNMTTISKNDISLPELPGEKSRRLEAETKEREIAMEKAKAKEIARAKEREKEAKWYNKPLQKRQSFPAVVLYNPSLTSDWRNALALEGGLGFGYRNLSIDGRFLFPIDSIINKAEGTGDLVYGLGLSGGYTYVGRQFLLSLEGGFTYYKDNNSDASAVLPLIEGKFDIVPEGSGLGFRIGYKLEFGSPQTNEFCKYYFGENNSFGGDSMRMAGNMSAGFVLWF